MLLSSLVGLVLLVQPPASVSVAIPKTLSAEEGDLVEVKAESGSELVSWDASDGLTITYPKNSAGNKTVFIHTKKRGTYALVASIPDGKETKVSICLVQFGPKVPPGPAPVPTFAENLQAAFDKDGKPFDKAALLAAIYRKASDTTVYDTGLKSLNELLVEVRTAAATAVGDPNKVLPATRQAVAEELPRLVGSVSTFDKSARDRVSAAFKSMASSLENLK